ncbi:hypothetical protein SYNPS1DRAFT_30882 [Syncephalis pseudoplumigaleata]|uniref:Uncharacterized protein n=1 Tax=Syncephalis pseudoplumigaleata TaxID=1712513 RepID=A0A4P9YUF1_9FUNG|nr:hypothetical protein SYNPS1DRAFT_30882 [Syncephalis pseudoplumigaleata]|eukprot:RKP23378.1 hypothetical protein SYNPS1DRAFT_30882 [Syncephalis pseudoplumigaleata]
MPDPQATATRSDENTAATGKERPAVPGRVEADAATKHTTHAMSDVDSPADTSMSLADGTATKAEQAPGDEAVQEDGGDGDGGVEEQAYTPAVTSSAERMARVQLLRDILDLLIGRSMPLLVRANETEDTPTTLQGIKERLAQGDYTSDTAIATHHLWRVGTDHPNWRKRALEKEEEDGDVVMQQAEEDAGEDEEARKKKEQTASRPTKIALYQRGSDAYLFSGSSTQDIGKDEKNDPLAKAGEIRKIAILPTPSLSQVPTMGQAVGPAVQPPIASLHRYRDWSAHRVQPVAFLDYGPYASFAPSYDINMANLSSSESARIALYKQQQRQQQQRKKQALATTAPKTLDASTTTTTAAAADEDEDEDASNIDRDPFKRHNIDLDMLTRLEAVLVEEESKKHAGMAIAATMTEQHPSPEVEAILLRNAGLLLELQVLQEERFADEYKSPKTVSELERQLAKTLEQNLAALAGKAAPRTLIASSKQQEQQEHEGASDDEQDTAATIIEAAMARLPHATPAYRGTLPPSRPFAYGSNYGTRAMHPPAATVMPGARSDASNMAQIQQQLLQQRQLQAAGTTSGRANAPITPVSYAGAGNRGGSSMHAAASSSTPANLTPQQQQQWQLLQRQQQAMATTMMMMQGNHGNVNAIRCLNCGTADSSTWRAMPGANQSAKLCNGKWQYIDDDDDAYGCDDY